MNDHTVIIGFGVKGRAAAHSRAAGEIMADLHQTGQIALAVIRDNLGGE